MGPICIKVHMWWVLWNMQGDLGGVQILFYTNVSSLCIWNGILCWRPSMVQHLRPRCHIIRNMTLSCAIKRVFLYRGRTIHYFLLPNLIVIFYFFKSWRYMALSKAWNHLRVVTRVVWLYRVLAKYHMVDTPQKLESTCNQGKGLF